MTDHNSVSELNDEIRKLHIENERLKDQLAGKKVPLSDAAVDGIVATILIVCASAAVIFWLSSFPY